MWSNELAQAALAIVTAKRAVARSEEVHQHARGVEPRW